MTGVTFGSDGSQQRTTAAIERMATKAAAPEPMLQESREILAANEEAVFESEGSTIGEAWAALSEDTIERKGSDRILVMTGRLKEALGNPGNVHISATSATLNAQGVPYAHFHVTGTSRMPARPFLGISPATQRELTALMSRFMTEPE